MTPDRVYRRGTFDAHLGVRVDAAGRVQEVALAAAMGPPTHALAGQLVLPAAARACVLTDLEWAFGLDTGGADLSARMVAVLAATEALPPPAVRDRLTAALAHAARRGIGTAGLLVPHDGFGTPPGTLWPWLTVAIEAAQAVGLRCALLFPFRPPPPPARHTAWLEQGYARLDAAVRGILSRQDDKLSWAVALLAPADWGDDDLVALRLRLGHLPLLVPHDDTIVARMQATRCLDACVSVLSAGAPSALERHALHTSGALWLQLVPRPGPLERQAPRHTSARTATSHSDPLLHVSWSHQAALAMRAGAVETGRWADWLLLPWTGEAQAFDAHGDVALPEGAAVWVAGKPVPSLATRNTNLPIA